MNRSIPWRIRTALTATLGSAIALSMVALAHELMYGMTALPLIIAAFGATAVVLFGAPESRMARPRSVFGGSIISSLIGVSVAQLMPNQPLWLGGMLAVCLSIAAMRISDTMHSPGGAMAFLAVASPPEIRELGFFYVIYPVGTGISIMYLVSLLFHGLLDLRRRSRENADGP